ncbi:MAG: DEAD/DEAH box helicase [Alphaproteobacteria bacterium]|nr:DEAD/DEAH box helicase [Alphaproteobacteria bacterium]HRW28401.1 DEAD/DEAH box helicase [Emcibacteraceae bacterium]
MTLENAQGVDTPVFDFDKFGFDKAIIKSIKNESFSTPTPIQDLAIPYVMGGSDLMGIAQTGSGKTAAFSLPIINKLIDDYQKPASHKPKVLILAPTRELVMQIGKFIEIMSRGTPIKNLVVAGGQSYQPQIRKLKYGVDILISTPGRLIDHMGSGNVKLGDCQTFILDEADRMLDMGFIDDVIEVRKSLPEDHQTIMFSATMNEKVRKLSAELLKEPEYVEQERKTVVADTISHRLMNVRRKDKLALLISLLQDEAIDKALVFARTKLGADKLCDELKAAFEGTDMRIDAIHGDKKQRTREKILLNYRKGRTKVLVATDVAARGIDVEGISHVINYELPIEAENYIHRVGRTGRAGVRGLAISFCDPSDVRLLRDIEKLIKLPIEVDEEQRFHFDISDVSDFKKGKRTRAKGPRSPKSTSRRPGRDFSARPEKRKEKPYKSESQRPVWEKNEKPARAKKAYDPLQDSYQLGAAVFGDDPVLKKLHGKAGKIKPAIPKAKKTDEPKGKREKLYGKKSEKPAFKEREKPAAKRREKPKDRTSGTQKQTGGFSRFSPKGKSSARRSG